jgi:hypothetical protein
MSSVENFATWSVKSQSNFMSHFVINYGGEISGPHGGEYEDNSFLGRNSSTCL